MASAEFSEFSYGFAYTREVIEECWGVPTSAPAFPSLYDEGKGKGFDVAIGLYGWIYFAQFKRSDFLARSNANWWGSHGGPYLSMPVEN